MVCPKRKCRFSVISIAPLIKAGRAEANIEILPHTKIIFRCKSIGTDICRCRLLRFVILSYISIGELFGRLADVIACEYLTECGIGAENDGFFVSGK